MVDSQEYRDILNQDAGAGDGSTLKDFLSTYNKEVAINDAIVTQALAEVQKAGYYTGDYYTLPTTVDGASKLSEVPTADNLVITTDSERWLTNSDNISPKTFGYSGYLLGDVLAPNGFPVSTGIAFPPNPMEGDYFLRLDYFPNRMFRFDGKKWTKIQDVQRTSQLPAFSQNQKSSFINNNNSKTLSNGQVIQERQTLSQALRAQAD